MPYFIIITPEIIIFNTIIIIIIVLIFQIRNGQWKKEIFSQNHFYTIRLPYTDIIVYDLSIKREHSRGKISNHNSWMDPCFLSSSSSTAHISVGDLNVSNVSDVSHLIRPVKNNNNLKCSFANINNYLRMIMGNKQFT